MYGTPTNLWRSKLSLTAIVSVSVWETSHLAVACDQTAYKFTRGANAQIEGWLTKFVCMDKLNLCMAVIIDPSAMCAPPKWAIRPYVLPSVVQTWVPLHVTATAVHPSAQGSVAQKTRLHIRISDKHIRVATMVNQVHSVYRGASQEIN